MIIYPQASDSSKVYEYLRATYGELGMDYEPPTPICQNEGLKVSRLFRKVIGDAPGTFVTIQPTPSVSRHAQPKPFDAGKYPSRDTRPYLDSLHRLIRLFLR